MQTPHRFRTKRHLWTYSGLGLETYDSAEYRAVRGQLERSRKQATVRGLNKDYNHDLKDIFKECGAPHSLKNVKSPEMWSWFAKPSSIAGSGILNATFLDRLRETPANRELWGLCSTECVNDGQPV